MSKIPPAQAQAAKAVCEIENDVVGYHRGKVHTSEFVPREIAEKAYLRGGLDAMRLYAWWRDGVEYVGSCGTPLAKAARDWVGDNPRSGIKPTTEETK